MDKDLKAALSEAFAAPPPQKKREFLKKYHRREISRLDFLLIQAGYIRWWIWGISVLLFCGSLWLASGQDTETIWVSAALIPFLALLVVVENGKSRLHGMEEFELSCRMSLRTVFLARMIILGLFHLLLLGILIPVIAAWGAVDILQVALYLLCPYLLTATIGFEISCHIRGNEGLLACATAAGLVCVLEWLIHSAWPKLYYAEAIPIWIGTLGLMIVASAVEFFKLMKTTEELKWS